MLDHIRSCPRCKDTNNFRPSSVSAMEIEFGALKTRRTKDGARPTEPPLFFYGLALCRSCKAWFFINFRIDADRFLQSYEECCPELYERDELALEAFFSSLKGTLEEYAFPESIGLNHIKEFG